MTDITLDEHRRIHAEMAEHAARLIPERYKPNAVVFDKRGWPIIEGMQDVVTWKGRAGMPTFRDGIARPITGYGV